MNQEIERKTGISNRGNCYRIKQVMKRAQAGEELTIAFIGGSITQGSLASKSEHCYAAHVYEWWKQAFPNATFHYINAGIGGTTSQFGTVRVQTDVLVHQPDLVFVEFSVNDDSTELYLETYEGLVRKIWSAESEPAIMLVHNVRYDNGANAQVQHGKIARYYDLPAVSMQRAIYPYVLDGTVERREITPDDLHPNDKGHAWIAAVITDCLEQMRVDADECQMPMRELPSPLTANRYEHAKRYQNDYENVQMEGFCRDEREQTDLTDCFKNGWYASKAGARIAFDISGKVLAVQYRKSVQHPAPIARLVVDGDEEHAMLLDGNFQETWGDCLYIETLQQAESVQSKETHHIEITLTEQEAEALVPFYLTAVLVGA